MRNLAVLITIVLVATGAAWADRCVGPNDFSGTVTQYGIATYAQSDIVWCDDFDTYCTANNGVIPGGVWPGYPPSPDNICTTSDVASDSWFRDATYHWPPEAYTPGGQMGMLNEDPVRGWDGNLGWPTSPFIARQVSDTTTYHTFDLAGAIGHKFSGSNAINGTDEDPLILRWFAYTPLGVGGYPNTPQYMELHFDNDRAPTDYLEWDCGFSHECNCYWSNTDATCTTGTCGSLGSCEAGSCDAGVCDWENNGWYCILGPRVGQSCDNGGNPDDFMCYECNGGEFDGGDCTTYLDCGQKACEGGANDGQVCTTNEDCAGTCSTGPNTGSACLSNEDCGACVGGQRPGMTCTSNHDCQRPCAYGTCNAGTCESNVCVGGSNPGSACTADVDCGTCTSGTNTGNPCDADDDCGIEVGTGQCDGGTNDGTTCGTWEEDGYYPSTCSGGPIYPMINQMEYNYAIPTCTPESPCGTEVIDPSPAPDTSTEVVASIAFGWLPYANEEGPVNLTPCNIATGKKPTNYHAQTFDGNLWRDLRSNKYLPGYGDFNFAGADGGQGFFQITIKSTVYVLDLTAPISNYTTIVDNMATLTRQYTGPFNKVSMGTGPGCKLAADGTCATSDDVYRYPSYNYNRYDGVGWTTAYLDRPVLLGGVGNTSEGACCDTEGGCTVTTSANCTGTWQGVGTDCDPNPCCPQVWADVDRDGDVDQADFAAFQICFSGAGTTASSECNCWDRDSSGAGDGDVDADDYSVFNTCWTGPNVPYSLGSLPTGCE